MTPADFRVDPADYRADFDALRHVRETVFVAEQQVPVEEEWDELDPQCQHVLARDADNRPIGTGRLTPQHKIGRMAVLKEWRGRGVGDALLVALMDKARSLGWTEVSLNAQVSAEAFYARHGFQPYGERFMEAGIEHQAMRRTLEPLAPPERGPAAPIGSRSKAPVPGDRLDWRLGACGGPRAHLRTRRPARPRHGDGDKNDQESRTTGGVHRRRRGGGRRRLGHCRWGAWRPTVAVGNCNRGGGSPLRWADPRWARRFPRCPSTTCCSPAPPRSAAR